MFFKSCFCSDLLSVFFYYDDIGIAFGFIADLYFNKLFYVYVQHVPCS